MYLTRNEEKMLLGEYGEGTQRALEYQVKVGEFFGAERMVPISFVMVGVGGGSPRRVGHKFFNELADQGATFRVPIATSALSDPVLERLGVEIGYGGGGTPRDLHAFPYFGGHTAAVGSNPTCFFNTVIGARANSEGGAGCMFAAITGRVPYYGLHLPMNRVGKVLVDVEAELKWEIADWSAMGYYVGRVLSKRWWDPPVFVGAPPNPLWDSLVYFCASLPAYGSVVMAHIINVTPEAHTLEDAFNGSEPEEKITFGQRELGEVYQTFTPTTRRVDVVNINLSVRKLYKTVRILRGRKTHKDVRLLLDAPLAVRAVANQYGLRTQIEAAGGLLRDSGIPRLWSEARKLGIRTVVTDDAKNCHYLGQQGVEPALRTLQECIDAAITGRLEDH